jgi:hypothetical protein
MKRYENVLDLKRQSGNRWNAAGITGREAIRLYEMARGIEKILDKKSLWVRHRRSLQLARDTIMQTLSDAGRLK